MLDDTLRTGRDQLSVSRRGKMPAAHHGLIMLKPNTPSYFSSFVTIQQQQKNHIDFLMPWIMFREPYENNNFPWTDSSILVKPVLIRLAHQLYNTCCLFLCPCALSKKSPNSGPNNFPWTGSSVPVKPVLIRLAHQLYNTCCLFSGPCALRAVPNACGSCGPALICGREDDFFWIFVQNPPAVPSHPHFEKLFVRVGGECGLCGWY